MPVKVLVTGAGGYLGSTLCPRLAAQGFQVLALDLPEKLQNLPKNLENLEVIAGDAASESGLKPLISKADVLVPLAALVGAPVCEQNPEEARRVNLDAVQMLDRLRGKNQRVLFPMTNNGYRARAEETTVDETSAFETDSIYTRTKFQAEEELLSSGNAVSFRLASLFGISPAVRWDLLLHFFLKQAFTQKKISLYEGSFKRSFLHLFDAADGFIHALKNPQQVKDGIYNLALEEGNISKHALALKIQKFLPDTKIEIDPSGKDPDVRDVFVSAAKIQKTGFTASRPLESGILELLAYLKMQPAEILSK